MTYGKHFAVFILSIFLSTSFVFASDCSFTNLGACSLGDLKDLVLNLIPFNKTKQVCPVDFVPVCGKDGNTYDNNCCLKEANQKLAYLGVCLEYPYNLSANECIRDGFEWTGYFCRTEQEKEDIYIDEDIGISFNYPENSLLRDGVVYLPKSRNNTNLFSKTLRVSKDCGESLLKTTKILKEYSQDNFYIIEGEDNLEYGKGVVKDIYYRDYVIKNNNECISFLFSLVSDDNSALSKYSLDIEDNIFNEILGSISMVSKIEKTSPCLNYGDLNSDGVINEIDNDFFDFGSIESNFQKRGDLNNDNLISLEDKIILTNFNLGIISTFPVCKNEKSIKIIVGEKPVIYYDKDTVVLEYNKDKTDLHVKINFSIFAENGDVYIPIKNGFVLDILNQENLNLRNFIWNTGASILDNGYILIEDGESTWIDIEFDLSAKRDSYSRILLNKLSYLNNENVLDSINVNIESQRIYLKKLDDKMVCPCLNYGDLNLDGYITQEDIDIINKGEVLDEKIADVSLNGIVNIIDAIEISRYLRGGEIFPVCLKNTKPIVYSNGSINVINNEGYSKHVSMVIYLDAENGNISIPLSMSLNQDEEAGIYLSTERDGNVKISNVVFHTGAFLEGDYFFLGMGSPYQLRIEFDVEAVNDTALVNFKLDKIAYLNEEGGIDYILLEDIETGDIFLNFKEEKVLSSCGLGDINLDGYITEKDYNYIKLNKTNLLFNNPVEFLIADVNKDGILNDLDLEEINNVVFLKQEDFSGCNKNNCDDVIESVYTRDGYIYSNLCYAKNDGKELKCYIDKDCGL